MKKRIYESGDVGFMAMCSRFIFLASKKSVWTGKESLATMPVSQLSGLIEHFHQPNSLTAVILEESKTDSGELRCYQHEVDLLRMAGTEIRKSHFIDDISKLFRAARDSNFKFQIMHFILVFRVKTVDLGSKDDWQRALIITPNEEQEMIDFRILLELLR